MGNNNIFCSDFKLEPYWWDRTPRPEFDEQDQPDNADVVVVGSGYTGLNAALQVARGGRSTLVLDADDAGHGCSTRNGGQISTSVKPAHAELSRKHGEQTAFNIIKEGQNSLQWIGEFIADEGIDCEFSVPGRFHAAHSQKAFDALVNQVNNQPKGLEVPAHIVPKSEQHNELGTDVYFGGVVFEKHASLDPGQYHKGLLDRVVQAGAQVISHCPVQSIQPIDNGFYVTTPKGRIKARDVVVATNGYTSSITPWQRRRVIPIGSYIIATEPLTSGVMDHLMPRNRIASDSRKVVYYYRASPDRSRILFGGRVSSAETDTQKSAGLLRRDLIKIFPDLEQVKISHSWMGFVAYTFDALAHNGKQEGIYYAMGYCGSGVAMASYLGMRMGQQVLGEKEGETGFDRVKFPTRPLYTGKPWFLATSVAYYRWLDRFS
ncbi:MAG: glycine/D-amino acid oxidase-like deaminating enzyme [Gammaproteobacteria bacterium]|jgi:glycine/D-amino acid oxidase-like deaminating enzyme